MVELAKRALDLLVKNIDTNSPVLLPNDRGVVVELFLKVFEGPGNELPVWDDLHEHLIRENGIPENLAVSILTCWEDVEMSIVGHFDTNWSPDVVQTLLEGRA